jgi:hypothetical protein
MALIDTEERGHIAALLLDLDHDDQQDDHQQAPAGRKTLFTCTRQLGRNELATNPRYEHAALRPPPILAGGVSI